MIIDGNQENIRLDNDPEFIAKALRTWLTGIDVKAAYIEQSSVWESDFYASFIGALRDDVLDGVGFL